MAVNGMSETTLVGRVVSVNDRGLKLDGEDAWRNVSKYAVGVVLPERGATVALTLDKAGFIRSCGPADGATPLSPAARPTSSSDKDRTITRLAVLKAAAEFAASKPDATAAAVIRVAEAWERWVLREPEPEPELEEAF
jgi:hypothetical protein